MCIRDRLYIEQDDFREDPPKQYYRLSPGREVRLRYGYFITANSLVKNDAGEVVEVHCTYDPATRGGNSPDGRKVKSTIHWVSAAHAIDAEVRLYDKLFTKEDPNLSLIHIFTTYRDAGFLPEAFINFLCLLGWSPKDNRENMSLKELTDAFSLEGINRANAVVNFKEPAATPDETFDPKALWLNAEHIRGLSVDDLSARLLPLVRGAGFPVAAEKMYAITPLIRERIKLLRDVLTAADFFFVDQLPPYDPAELIPQKGDAAMALKVLTRALEVLPQIEFQHDPLDQALRAAAQEMGFKAGQMFQPIRVAVCGRKNAPPLFETLQVLGRETTLKRIEQAIKLLP